MRRDKIALAWWAGLLIVGLGVAGCASPAVATRDTFGTENSLTQTPTTPVTATAAMTPAPTQPATATATAASTGGPPLAGPAGQLIPHTTAGSQNLAWDAAQPDHLRLFFESADPSGGNIYNTAQQNADGSWLAPSPLSPPFQFLSSLSAVPDAAGRRCVAWSGEQYDANGNDVYGLWRNCETEGGWTPQAEPLALTAKPALFSPVRAADGGLVSVLITPAGRVEGLYFSAIGGHPTAPLTGTLLSGARQVLLARLVIDASGGYHAAWVETSGDTQFSIEYRASTDQGKTWSAAQELYAGTDADPTSIGFQLAAGAPGQVHLAWDAQDGVHYRGWTAAQGWSDDTLLSGAGRNSGVALVVDPAGLASAAWKVEGAMGGVMLATQAANGAWSAPALVASGVAFEVALASGPGGEHALVWRADDGLRYLAVP